MRGAPVVAQLHREVTERAVRECTEGAHCDTLREAGLDAALLDHPRGYGVVTLHRPSNVDEAATLHPLLEILAETSLLLPLVFAMHPRTRNNIQRFGLQSVLDPRRVAVLPPQGYLEMVGLMKGARLVLTDSGGLQEETTALGVPCLTARENTERPVTVDEGTNTLAGTDPQAILGAARAALSQGGKQGRVPHLWDGKAAERIVAVLEGMLK